MTYDPGIPQDKDDMSVSQGDMLTNFTQLASVWGSSGDHVELDAASNRGKHKKTTLVSQGSDPDTDSPSTEANEMVLFTLEDGTDTEIYMRRESNGAVRQMTKDNELFIDVHPVFAINIKDLTPNSNVGLGTYNFTVSNSFNFDSANSKRVTAGRTHYLFTFTNQVLDSAGSPTNNYLWSANGFDSSGNAVPGSVATTATYGDKVKATSIEIEFRVPTGAVNTKLTGASIICWRFQ